MAEAIELECQVLQQMAHPDSTLAQKSPNLVVYRFFYNKLLGFLSAHESYERFKHHQNMGEITPKNEGNVGSHGNNWVVYNWGFFFNMLKISWVYIGDEKLPSYVWEIS